MCILIIRSYVHLKTNEDSTFLCAISEPMSPNHQKIMEETFMPMLAKEKHLSKAKAATTLDRTP